MKKFKIYLLLFLGVIPFLNCKKEFLTQTPQNAVPATGITNVTDLQNALTGMYYDLRIVYGNNISGETNSNARDIPVMGDLKGDNTYLSGLNSGRYIRQNSYTFDNTDSYGADIWTACYQSVRDANLIINSKVPASAAANEIFGEAYAARALSYFQLVTHYAPTYSLDPKALGVPLILSTSNLTLLPARSSIDSVYNQILADLGQAFTLMTVSKGSFFFSKYAARALQARVYLTKGDYTNALAAANDVITNGGYSLLPIVKQADTSKITAYWFNTASTIGGETILEFNQSNTVNAGGNSLANFYGQASGSYGDALCTNELYNLYSSTDGRRNTIYQGFRFSTTTPALIANKYPHFADPNAKDNLKIIRFAEMYLIAAEAQYNLGNIPGALSNLNAVATNRDPAFIGYVDTGAQLLADILNERRKEFAFEGYRFFDLVRLNLPIVRPSAAGEYPPSGSLIAPSSYLRTLPIPKAETDVNPNIVQNPGYTK